MLIPAVICTGATIAVLAWVVADIMTRPREIDPELGRFEVERVEKLRQASASYRMFEPWVNEVAAMVADGNPKKLDEVEKDLVSSGEPAPWKASEYMALARIDAVITGLGAAMLVGMIGGWFAGLLFGGLIFYLVDWSRVRQLKSKAFRRRVRVKRRFATAVDLMALMLEVGGNFQESLEVAAAENRGTVLGEELSRVIKDIRLGRTRREALLNMSQRMQDDDISELTMAIVEGEELGTPLAKTLRIQSDQFRQKRSFWAEKAAAEAQVALVFPAILIMVACLLTVAAPFILSAMNIGG